MPMHSLPCICWGVNKAHTHILDRVVASEWGFCFAQSMYRQSQQYFHFRFLAAFCAVYICACVYVWRWMQQICHTVGSGNLVLCKASKVSKFHFLLMIRFGFRIVYAFWRACWTKWMQLGGQLAFKKISPTLQLIVWFGVCGGLLR